MSGRYVIVQMNHAKPNYLNLREVRAFGHSLAGIIILIPAQNT